MAPRNPSHRSREEFFQWNEASRVLGNGKHGKGVASHSGARKKNQATREKVIVDAPVHSRTGTESTSGQEQATETESGQIQPAMDEISNGATQTPNSAASKRFVPPRPNTPSTSRGQQQGPSVPAVHQFRQASMSPQGRHDQRVQLQVEGNIDARADCKFEDTSIQRSAARTPGMALYCMWGRDMKRRVLP